MSIIKGRNLFAAILAARAICGIGAAQAQPVGYTAAAKTPGPGQIITGVGATSGPDLGLVAGLDTILGSGLSYNDVTLNASAPSATHVHSLTTLPFVDHGPNGNVLSNTLTLSDYSYVDVSGGAGVVLEGYKTDGNSVTLRNAYIHAGIPSDPNSHQDGIEFFGENETSGNTVVIDPSGAIVATGSGIVFGSEGLIAGNRVNNGGLISAGNVGIVMQGHHITGRVDASGALLDSITNSGTISGGVGILLGATDGIESFQITNTSGGAINASGVGILLDSSGGITKVRVDNAGRIAGLGVGVLLEGNHIEDSVVNNTGTLVGGGVVLNASGDLERNSVINAGRLDGSGNGITLYSDAGTMTQNQVRNETGKLLTVRLDHSGTVKGIALEGENATLDTNTVTNAGTLVAGTFSVDGSANTIVSRPVNLSSGGTIRAEGIALETSDHVTGNTVNNTGNIQVLADASGNAAIQLRAYGINLNGYDGVSGNILTNAGTIIADAHLTGDMTPSGDTIRATGIQIGSDHGTVSSNTVTSTGTILASASDSNGNASSGSNGISFYAGDRADCDLEKNTVTLGATSLVQASRAGVVLSATARVLDNHVANAGRIIAGRNGIALYSLTDDEESGQDISGSVISNDRGGLIQAGNKGIFLESWLSNQHNTVSNAGTITLMNAEGRGIELTSDRSNVSDNIVTNAGPATNASGASVPGVINVSTHGAGILLSAAKTGALNHNTVTNAGLIHAGLPSDSLVKTTVEPTPAYVNGIFLRGGMGAIGNTLVNDTTGAIILGNDSHAMSLYSGGDASGNTVVNRGSLTAGEDSTGISLQAYHDALDNVVTNAGKLTLGNGDALGIEILGERNVTHNTVTNAGELILGTDVSGGSVEKAGIVIGGGEFMHGTKAADTGTALFSVSENTVLNAGTLSLTTDDSYGSHVSVAAIAVGGLGGYIPGKAAGYDYLSAVSGNTVTNSGTITVKTNDPSGSVFAGGIMIGAFSDRVPGPTPVKADDPVPPIVSISNNTLTNSGTITLATTSTGDVFAAALALGTNAEMMGHISGNTLVNTATGHINAGHDGVAILLGDTSGFHSEAAGKLEAGAPSLGLTGNTVINAGTITAGHAGILVGDYFETAGNTVLNSGTIDVTGDHDLVGLGFQGGHPFINAAPAGGPVVYNRGNTLTNTGTIRVTSSNVESAGGGSGVVFRNINGSTIDNLGTIDVSGKYYAEGVEIYGNQNTLTNWGRISATTTSTNSSGVEGIYVSGSGNVVNLNGHSSVQGKITGIGVDPSGGPLNTLNLNFTGLSPETMAALKATIASQVDPVTGMPTTTDGTVRFTVRGVNYVVDPMLIDPHLLSSYELQGETGNQSSVGANLDSLTTNPDPGTDLWKLLYAVDNSGEVPKALGELSPQRYQIYGDIAVSQMSGISQQVDNRLVALYDGDMPEKKGNLWATIGHKSATVDGIGHDLENAKFSTDSVVVGADYRVSPAFTLGALFHYSTTDHAKMDEHGSRADVDSKGVGVYAGFRQGGIYANGLVTYSNNDYESSRKVAFTGYDYTAKGDTSGHQTGVGIDGGYDFKVSDALTVGPFGGLQYVHLSVDGFKEKGAPAANLAVDSQTMTSLLGRVGGRLNYTASMGGMNTFGLDLHAALQHEFKNDARNIRAKFIGSGLDAFSVKTEATDRNSFLLGVGFNFNFHGTTSVFANYDMQGGQSNWHEQNIKGGVKISF